MNKHINIWFESNNLLRYIIREYTFAGGVGPGVRMREGKWFNQISLSTAV